MSSPSRGRNARGRISTVLTSSRTTWPLTIAVAARYSPFGEIFTLRYCSWRVKSATGISAAASGRQTPQRTNDWKNAATRMNAFLVGVGRDWFERVLNSLYGSVEAWQPLGRHIAQERRTLILFRQQRRADRPVDGNVAIVPANRGIGRMVV